ncbi:MAG: hypothetical protein QOD12_3036 [Verrucomicrobiota bacterium]|jgi:hypothetical protein
MAFARPDDAAASTVSPVTVPLSKAVSQSSLIIVGTVERIGNARSPDAVSGDPGFRYFQVRVDEILKSADKTMKNLKGQTLPIFDPQEKFYHDQREMIAAEVICFVDPRYPTRVQKIAARDRLVFFISAFQKLPTFPEGGAYRLVCGQAYDTLARRRAVLKRSR